MKPTLSVITICFNNLPDLVRTCRSVDDQSLPPLEHLVIDGSTNEDILHWLMQNPQPAYRKWIHESDKGIADAFNKGISHATGELTHLLNSGDHYADPTAIRCVLEIFESDPQLMWVHGQYIQHRGDLDVISGVPFDSKQLWKGMRTVAHPSMFIRKEVYDRHGSYDLDYKIAMDYDMLVRMRNEKHRFIAKPLVYFAPGGASNVQFEKGLKEVRRSHNKYIGKNLRQTFWQFRQRVLHAFMQTGLGKRWFQWKNNKKKMKAL